MILTLFASCTSETSKGEQLFAGYCLRCHGADLKGAIVQADVSTRPVWKEHPDSLVKILVFGASGVPSHDEVGKRTMPPVPYTDQEIAELTQYLLKTIANRTETVTAQHVSDVRRQWKAVRGMPTDSARQEAQ